MQAIDLLVDGRLADIRSREEVRAAVDGLKFGSVIHLAGLTSVPESLANPTEAYQTNFVGTLNLLLALRDCGFRGRFLYVGTADAYGVVPETALPVTEELQLRPLNPYAASKTAAEALCFQWSHAAPFEIVMVRPFNHIGPGQSPRFAVADFAQQVVLARLGARERVLHVGDVDTTRDFTDVRDIVDAYACLLRSGVNGQVYNVCSGVERSLRQVIEALCEAAGIQVELRVAPERLRPVEQRRMRGSHAKLSSHTNWQPSTDFSRTIQDILDHWEANAQHDQIGTDHRN